MFDRIWTKYLIEAHITLQTKLTSIGRGGGEEVHTGPHCGRKGGVLLPDVQPRLPSGRHPQDVPRQGLRREAVLFHEVGHRHQAHTGLDGRRGLRCAAHRFLAQALIADTYSGEASRREGDEIHLRRHAKVDTYDQAQRPRGDGDYSFQLQPLDKAVLRAFGVIPEDVRCELANTGQKRRLQTLHWRIEINCQIRSIPD